MGQKKNSTIFSLSLKNSEWKSKYMEKNLEESSVLLYQNLAIWNYLNQSFKRYNLILYNWKIEHYESSISLFLFFFEKNSETRKYYKKNLKQVKKDKHNQVSAHKYSNCPELIIFFFNNILSRELNLFTNSKTINVKTQNLNKKFEVFIRNNPIYSREFKKLIKPFRRSLKNPNFKELIKILYCSVIEKDSAKLIAESIANYFQKNKKKHGFILSFLKKILIKLIYAKFSRVKGVKIVINGRFNGAQRSNKKIVQIGRVPLQSFNLQISYYEDVAYTSNGTFGIRVWIHD